MDEVDETKKEKLPVPGHTCIIGWCWVKNCPGNPDSYVRIYNPEEAEKARNHA
jgi:hypothetical protein